MKRISEEQLNDSLARLPREREPRNELWPGIQARLQDQLDAGQAASPGVFQRRFGIAAMLAIAVIIGYQAGLERGTVMSGKNFAAAQQVYGLEGLSNEYVGAIREAAALTAQQRDTRMPVESIEGMQASMKNILQTEAMLREAIRAEPDNEYLAMLLVRLQSRQLQLIQEIPQIEQQIWRTL